MRVDNLGLETIDGLVLDAEVAVPPAPRRGAAVVCHPHPLYGGTKENPVVVALWQALAGAGFFSLRFDFRGAGGSPGEHGEGELERLDVVAAIDAVAPLAGDGPVVLAGYSFGAAVALSVTDPRLAGWLAVAPPLAPVAGRTLGTPSLAGHDHRPKLLVVPAHDQFCPPAAARAATEGWTATEIVEVPMADHFLAGGLATTADAARTFTDRFA